MEIGEIVNQFDFKGSLVSCKAFGSGHINTTYVAKYDDNGKTIKYVVQLMNPAVFKNIDGLMDNVFEVTSYLRKQIRMNDGDENRETLHFVKTKDGKRYFTDETGNSYRAYIYVRNSVSYDSVDSEEIFMQSGLAFGKFQRLLADFPVEKLNEIIPDFHNTFKRFNDEFLPSLEKDSFGRAGDCQEEIDFILNRKGEMSKLTDLEKDGKIPLRVTHNDTKLNNVMFDKDSNKAVCVIDLDTVMPGLALYDIGDSIRFGANTASEDEKDLDKVKINLDYFKAYVEGFLFEAGKSLNSFEIENIAFASKLMTLECGMRFLTDYLNGDIYFKTNYDTHNLDRAKNQLALVFDMEKNLSKMEDIVKQINK